MKKTLIVFVSLLAFAACKNNTETNTDTAEEAEVATINPNDAIEKGCYRYSNGGSVIEMEITESDTLVAGNLHIAYAEKDASEGTFIGKMNGDKLMASYDFMSEGKKSTREIAFQLKNNQLIEGFTEMDSTGTKFKDSNLLKYDSTMPLSRVDCSDFSESK